MKLKKNTLTLLTIIIILLIDASVLTGAAQTEQASLFDSSADLIILHTNDTHGYVKADDSIIGFDRIAAMKKSVEGKSLLLDAGDMSNEVPFAAKSKGLAPIQVMNNAGYDAATLGDHEFDMPDDNVLKIIDAADFPLLSANIRRTADGSYLTAPYKIFTIQGIKAGVFGLTSMAAAVNPITSAGLDFGTVESIKRDAAAQADELRSAGCELVILLSHLGTEPTHSAVTSIDIAEALGDALDAIIDGHSHTSPSMNQTVNGVPVVSAGGTSDSNVGWMEFNRKTGGGFEIRYGYIDFQTAYDHFSPDPEVRALIGELNKPVEAMATNIVAVSDADLNGERNAIRTGETNLGNLTADAAKAFTGADAAMVNSGGIRASLQAGELTELNVYTVFPFGDSIYMSEVKGSVILEALEHAVSNYPAAEGTFAQVSGLTFSFDPDRPVNNRIISADIGGQPLDPNAVYKLATNDFWAIGGNGFTMFEEPFRNPGNYDKPQASIYMMDVFIWHLNQTDGVTPGIENRIRVEAGEIPVSPKTGDKSAIYIAIAIAVLGFSGVAGFYLLRNRKESGKR